MKVIIMALTIILAAYIMRPQPSLEQVQLKYVQQIELLQKQAQISHDREIEKLKLQVEIERINVDKPVEIRKAEVEAKGRADLASEITTSAVGFMFVILILGLAYRFTYPFKPKDNA